MRDYSVLNGMIENQKSELRTAYDKGYNQSVKDFDLILATSKKEEEGYNRGVNDLWESVCKFMDADITSDKEIWGCISWEKFAQLSPFEIIERLKEYNKKHYDLPETMRGEINIGDEVRNMANGCLGVVIKKAFEGYITVVSSWGNTYSWETGRCNKTGKCYKQFAEAISSLQDDE